VSARQLPGCFPKGNRPRSLKGRAMGSTCYGACVIAGPNPVTHSRSLRRLGQRRDRRSRRLRRRPPAAGGVHRAGSCTRRGELAEDQGNRSTEGVPSPRPCVRSQGVIARPEHPPWIVKLLGITSWLAVRPSRSIAHTTRTLCRPTVHRPRAVGIRSRSFRTVGIDLRLR
jgi:hypothetical protein